MKDKSPIIFNISTIEDIEKLKELSNVKYINVDITSPNIEVINYLIENGENYLYSDRINDMNGYIYVPHNIFKEGSIFIFDIINSVNPELSKIEIAKYLYIQIGKQLGYDINIFPDKNETCDLSKINTINNIWGSIHNKRGTNISFTKLYLYLCRLANIDCEIIQVNEHGYLVNKLEIGNNKIMTDITQDIPYIQSNFKTRFFTGYNDDIDLDKKIKYIDNDYSENLIQKSLRDLDYNNSNFFKEILLETQDIVTAKDLKPIELGIIYDSIFSKYCPNYEISINNLFINNKDKEKEHFILLSYDDNYYSFNYTKNTFAEIPYDIIRKNIESNKIGIYLNEEVPNLSVQKKKAA